MVKVSFSPKEAIAEVANIVLKAYLIANGLDEQIASMFGVGVLGAIKGVSIESRKYVKSGLEEAIKRAWVEILSQEKFENLNEDCKTALQNDILSASTAVEDLSAENPVSKLRERIRPILQKYTDESENDIYNYAGNMAKQLLLAINNEIEYDGILTLLKGIEQLKYDLAASTDKLENTIDAELSKLFKELMEKLEEIEPNNISARSKENFYRQLKDLFDYEREHHPSILMMKPDPNLFPNGLPEILSDRRHAIEKDEPPRAIKEMILESWKLQERKHILLIGEGGIGKTVAMLTLPEEDWFKKFGIPVIYVPLQSLDIYKGDLNRYLKTKFGADNYNHIINLANYISDGSPRMLLLLDGFNEIPDIYKKTAGKHIRDWMKRPGVQIITTSRLGFSLENHFAKYRLQPLPYDTVRSFLLSAGIKEESIPGENDRISKVINVPLMLAIYTQIEKVKELADCSSAATVLDWKEPDNAAHIIWNYLQIELYRSIERDDTPKPVMQYTIALLAVAPYICCQMSHKAKYFIKQGDFIKLISEALIYYDSHQNLLNNQILNVRKEFAPYHKLNLFQETEATEYAKILIDNSALFQKQRSCEGDSENKAGIDYIYSLMHQNFRDALSAFFICPCLSKTSSIKEKTELLDYADFYIKNYMAEYLSSQELVLMWDRHRNEEPEDGHITWILLDLIGRQRNYDYRELNFSGIDLTKTKLHRLLSKRVDICPLSPDKENFKLTKVSLECLFPDGHTGVVNSVAYSPDGRRLSSGSDDSTVRIWDLESGESRVLQGHARRVNSVAYSPDGRYLASGSDDGMLRIWDLESGGNCVLKGNDGGVYCVVYSPEGRYLASGSDDGTLRIWDLESRESRMLKGTEGRINSVAYSPAGGHLASGSDDGTLRIWDLESGESRVLKGHKGWISSVAYSPSGKYLASGASDNTVRIWDLESRVSCVLQGHASGVVSITYSPDGRYLASGAEDKTVQIWDLETGESCVLQGYAGGVRSVAYSPDGRHLANGSVDGTLRIWDLENGENRILEGDTGDVLSVAYSPDGRHLVGGLFDRTVRIWDLERRESCVLQGHADGVRSVAYSPDGRHLASGSFDRTVRTWDLESGESRVLQGHADGVYSVAYSPDGKHLASGSGDRTVRIWDLESGKNRVLQGYAGWINSLTYSPDGRYLASGATGRTVQFWNLESGDSCMLKDQANDSMVQIMYLVDKENHELVGYTSLVSSIAYSPDGKQLAIVDSNDRTVRIWDLESGESRVLHGHKDVVFSVAYSPDGKYLASGAFDKTLRIWNLESGESCVLYGHEDEVYSVAYSPDGRYLASGASDNTVRIWDLEEYQEVEKIVIIPHLNLCGANFELAVIDEKDKEELKAAGVRV